MKKSAFTLLEMMVVLGVIAFLTGLGTIALIRFRNYTQLTTSFNELVTAVKVIQNNAKNSVASSALSNDIPNAVPDYYTIRVENNSYDFFDCINQSNRIECSSSSTQQDINIPTGVQVQAEGCAGIAYERLTGNLVLVQTNGAIYTTQLNGSCTIRLTSTSLGDVRTIVFNADNDTLELN